MVERPIRLSNEWPDPGPYQSVFPMNGPLSLGEWDP